MEKIIINNKKEFIEIPKEYNQIIFNITRVMPYPPYPARYLPEIGKVKENKRWL